MRVYWVDPYTSGAWKRVTELNAFEMAHCIWHARAGTVGSVPPVSPCPDPTPVSNDDWREQLEIIAFAREMGWL